MATRSSLTFLAFTAALGFTSIAQAQHRPRHGRHTHPIQTAAVGAHGPAAPATGQLRETGMLGGDTEADAEGRYESVRAVNLTAGDSVTFGVSSSEFDALARVRGPNGETWEDDDGAGHGNDALLRFVAPETGRYELVATSYEAGSQGSFHADVAIQHGAPAATVDEGTADDQADDQADDGSDSNDPGDVPVAPSNSASGTTYGIFVGITNYRGENHDLPGSAADAHHLEQSFEHAGWMDRSNAVVLTDESATFDQVQQAFATLAPRVGPHDMLVFFFDGHGNTEDLDLRGRDLARRELSHMLDHVAGRSLIVLDSCDAAGFASVVQGHANRAGLFSSRADEESSTASAVGAGGWLAWHFRRAVDGGVQRRADGSVDFGDVVRYVQSQYRQSNVTDQHLVAMTGSRGGAFAIGGASDGSIEPTLPSNVAVARNDRRPVPQEPVAGDDQVGAGQPGAFPSAEGFGQMLNMGVGLANGVLRAITK